MTSYYAGVNGPVALRRTGYTSNNGIFYMLDDHLRSTGVILNQNGTVSAQQYYYPFGGNRGGAFSPITTKRFTGQYHESGLPGGEGLSYYNARWYDSQLGRFLNADTIVPQPWNPQSFNRLSYVHNNPMGYIDPSGHALVIGSCRGCGGESRIPDYAPPPVSIPSSTWSEWAPYRGQQRVDALSEWITYFRYKAALLGENYRTIGGKSGATFGEMVSNLEGDRKRVVTSMGGERAIKQVVDENPELFALGIMMTIQGGVGVPKYDRLAYGKWDTGKHEEIFMRDNYTCSYCGKRGGNLQLDHVNSVQDHWNNSGGHSMTKSQRNAWYNDSSNLVTACPTCNQSKGSSSLLRFLDRVFRR